MSLNSKEHGAKRSNDYAVHLIPARLHSALGQSAQVPPQALHLWLPLKPSGQLDPAASATPTAAAAATVACAPAAIKFSEIDSAEQGAKDPAITAWLQQRDVLAGCIFLHQ